MIITDGGRIIAPELTETDRLRVYSESLERRVKELEGHWSFKWFFNRSWWWVDGWRHALRHQSDAQRWFFELEKTEHALGRAVFTAERLSHVCLDCERCRGKYALYIDGELCDNSFRQADAHSWEASP